MKVFLTSIKLAVAALVAACALATSAFAADLSGDWIRDSSQSESVPYPTYWLTRGGEDRARDADDVITVRHDGDTLQITGPVQPQRTILLDGMPHAVATDTGVQTASVTATMRGDALVIDRVQPYGEMPGNVALQEQQTWQLAPDGGTLVVVTTRTTPARRESYTEVYHKS